MAQRRTEETREKVIDAARELLLEHGINSVSLKDISQASGVSNGSIFHHFGSKDGVMAQVFVAERGRYLMAIAKAIWTYEGDPCEAMGQGVRAAILYQMEDPQRFSRLVLEFTDSEWMRENPEVWLGVARTATEPMLQWAGPHMDAGRLPRLPAAFMQAFLTGGTERLVSNFVLGRLEEDPRDLADEAARFYCGGLQAVLAAQQGSRSGGVT